MISAAAREAEDRDPRCRDRLRPGDRSGGQTAAGTRHISADEERAARLHLRVPRRRARRRAAHLRIQSRPLTEEVFGPIPPVVRYRAEARNASCSPASDRGTTRAMADARLPFPLVMTLRSRRYRPGWGWVGVSRSAKYLRQLQHDGSVVAFQRSAGNGLSVVPAPSAAPHSSALCHRAYRDEINTASAVGNSALLR